MKRVPSVPVDIREKSEFDGK